MPIKLIASDLDGTILSQDNSIPEANFKAFDDITNNKIPFAICTGKSYAISKQICKKCNARYGIFGNGTQIVDLKEQKEIFHNSLSLNEIATCYKIAKKHGLHIHAYGDNFIITEELKYMDLHNYITFSKESGSVFGKYDASSNLCIKNTNNEDGLCFYVVKNLLKYIEENNLCIFNIALSSDTSVSSGIEDLKKLGLFSIQLFYRKAPYIDQLINKEYEYASIAPANSGKGYALNILKNYLKINTTDVLSVGDNLNDIDLLQNSGIGVAVANAYDDLKKVATYTTFSNASNGGFAEAVYQYIDFSS